MAFHRNPHSSNLVNTSNSTSFNTIEELRNSTALSEDIEFVILRGRETANDNRGGIFLVDREDTSTSDITETVTFRLADLQIIRFDNKVDAEDFILSRVFINPI